MEINLLDVLEAADNAGALKPTENENPNFYDNAIVGITEDGRLVYGKESMAKYLEEFGEMDYNEAFEYLEYNCFNSHVGKMTPIFINQYN